MLWTTTNILICETGYPLAIDSRDRTPKQILQDVQNNYSIVFRRIPKVFGGYKKIQNTNSDSMCKFRPIGRHSIYIENAPNALLLNNHQHQINLN